MSNIYHAPSLVCVSQELKADNQVTIDENGRKGVSCAHQAKILRNVEWGAQ